MNSRTPTSIGKNSLTPIIVLIMILLAGCVGGGSGSAEPVPSPPSTVEKASAPPSDAPTGETSAGQPAPSTAPRVSVSSSPEGPTAGPAPGRQRLLLVPPSGSEQPQESELPRSRGALGDSGNTINQIDIAYVTKYAEAVIVDADKVWSSWMTGLGYPEPYVQYFIIQPNEPLQVEQPCAVPDTRTDPPTITTTVDSQFPNAFYCGAQSNRVDRGILILPVESLGRMWSGQILGNTGSDSAKVGDFAAATVVAHEFGHHIQDELTEAMNIAEPPGKNTELLADCFAGVWTTALYQDGNLEEGDIDEALNALRVMGDKPNSDPKFPHGSPEDRENAFRLGIYGSQADPRGGVPGTCIKSYWPSFTGPV